MATANTTSSAKPLCRISKGNIIVTVFPEGRYVLQRRYRTRDGKLAYASSFRDRDLHVLKTVLANAEMCLLESQEATPAAA